MPSPLRRAALLALLALSAPARPAHADDAPLRLVIAGDTQIQTLQGGKVLGQIGQLEDRVVKVSMRPPALRLLSPLALHTLLTARTAGHDFDAILYLGDGANSGCDDEVTLLIKTLEAVRTETRRPVYILPGNHDYLGSGNTNDWSRREKACDRAVDATKSPNRPLSKAEVIKRIDAFNRDNDFDGWVYDSNIVDAGKACGGAPELGHPQDTRAGCFLAGLVTHDDTQILLTDTSDYHDAKQTALRSAYRGIGGALSTRQQAWFTDETAGRSAALRVVASHYPLTEETRPSSFDCPGCRRTLWLSAHTHTAAPHDTEAQTDKRFVYNVGSTTDHRPHAAWIEVDARGMVGAAPIWLAASTTDDGLAPADRDAIEAAEETCRGFIAGLERGGVRPWRVRPVLGQSDGLAVYGLDRTYQAFYWTDDDTERAAQNLGDLLSWHRGATAPRDDITSGAGRATLTPAAAAPGAPRAAQMSYPELVTCLATTAARLEVEPLRFDAPARVQVDERALYAAADLRVRAGDAQQPGRLDAPWDPTYDGVLTAGLDWSRRIRIETGLRVVGEAGDPETPRRWAVELDAASVHMGDHSPSSQTTWGFTGGHLPLTLGDGSLLDAREWLVRPPRFDGVDAAAGWYGFSARAGVFEAPGGGDGHTAAARQLYLLSLGYCHDTAGAPERPAPGEHHGTPAACLAADRVEAAVDGLVLADADALLWNAGLRVAAQGDGALHWRLAGEAHLQIDGGLGEPAPDGRYQALQAAARGRLRTRLGELGVEAGAGYEWLSGQGDRLAAFDPLYGRRHDRFGPGDLFEMLPGALGGEGLHALTVDAALLLPSSVVTDGRLGARYAELVDLGRDAALVVDLGFRVMRFELRGGRRALEAGQSARSGVGVGGWTDWYGLALVEAGM